VFLSIIELESFENVPSVPNVPEWKFLTEWVGDGKYFSHFHKTGLLPYHMNKNINVEDCSLTNVYKTYPRASWPYAFSCSNRCENIFNEIGRNTVCHNVVYVAEAHFHSDSIEDMDKLDWIRNQEDIVELDRLYNGVDKDRNPK